MHTRQEPQCAMYHPDPAAPAMPMATSLAQEEIPAAPSVLDVMQALGSCVKGVGATPSVAGAASRPPVSPRSRWRVGARCRIRPVRASFQL